MIRLYHAPGTRSTRILWLLEELGLDYELERMTFVPPAKAFSQDTPSGKLPVIEDDGATIFESGAILEYILERYGEGRLAPPVGTTGRGHYLQWIHFAESTLYPPLGVIVWHSFYAKDADQVPSAISGAHGRASGALDVLEKALDGKQYLLGNEFTGADIMMGFTLGLGRGLGVVDDRYPRIVAYHDALQERLAFVRAMDK